MQFQFIELHVQHAISETRLHVRSSNCMFICELHVEHAVRCTIQRMMINFNNKMHVERVWCFRICTSHNNLHVEHVILFLSDMHIEVSYMHFWHADRRCWMHVGHHIVKSKIMTNMGMLFLFDSQTWSCVSQHTHEGGCLKGLWCLLWSKTTQYMRRCFASAGTRCTQRVDCPWGCSRLLKRVSVTAVSGAARGSAAPATSG